MKWSEEGNKKANEQYQVKLICSEIEEEENFFYTLQ